MAILGNILGNLLGKADKIVDEVITSQEEKMQLKNELQKIIKALAEVGLTRRLGIAKLFIHTDDSQKTDAIWLY